jgi:hypothetical protein
MVGGPVTGLVSLVTWTKAVSVELWGKKNNLDWRVENVKTERGK